ncbi:NUDIX domain-containing protein [Streptomyces caniscabiei]|uniref:NUDIX domain-containing protein n=1 Tax=Streptomyces caniscabiei TaxID=2746961 RepID=UPI0029AFCD3B|nr:NUDIX domain-containing protein [Streptomyces caniscabiei]MDX2776324.1 NUDIX domain-containing protein [Streptomyces caniscabiei]
MKPRRITVRGIIIKNGHILAQELTPGSDGLKRDYWCTPGGGLEPNESLIDGLRREMIEETGVDPVIGKLLFVQQYEDDEKEFIEFFFHITNADAYETIDLAATSHGLEEIENVEFIDPATHNLLPAFLQSVNIKKHIDSDQPVIIANNLNER